MPEREDVLAEWVVLGKRLPPLEPYPREERIDAARERIEDIRRRYPGIAPVASAPVEQLGLGL